MGRWVAGLVVGGRLVGGSVDLIKPLSLTEPIANNTINNGYSEVFEKNLVEDFNDLRNNFVEEVNSFRNELLANYVCNINNQNTGSKRLITHLLNQISFHKDQLKLKDQMIDTLIEQLSKRDKAHL